MSKLNETSIEQKILKSTLLPEDKEELLAIVSGSKLPPLTSDVVAKHVFNPDEHPERLDYLLQKIMRDSSIATESSAGNEGHIQSEYSKKMITDIPAWLKDHRLADLEVQVAAQDYIFNRAELYSSDMLLVQYTKEENRKASDVGFINVNGTILVVLMRYSPKFFNELSSKRYIHRITEIPADSGLVFKPLRKMAFVQLDKALALFKEHSYLPDEDLELLKRLAFIADVNDEDVKTSTVGDPMLESIRKDVSDFAKTKEGQAMLLDEKYAKMDWKQNFLDGKNEGRAEGQESALNLMTKLLQVITPESDDYQLLKNLDVPGLMKLADKYGLS